MFKGTLLCLALALSGCGGLLQGLAPEYRTMESGGHAHGLQTASFIYSFADGSTQHWMAALDKLEADALPMLRALKAGGHDMRLELRDYDGPASVDTYELTMRVDGRALEQKPGGSKVAYDEALEQVAANSKLDTELLRRGHRALHKIVEGLTSLNATHDFLKTHAFKLLLLRAKLLQGDKQVDWFDPNRPKEESLADVQFSLRLIEDEHRHVTRRRAAILAIMAMTQRYSADGALDLLVEQLEDSRASAQAWRTNHKRPTAEEHGVRAAALPTPADIRKHVTEKLGFVGSLAKGAEAVITANPNKAIEALTELAPEDSSAKRTLEGLSAAMKGDVVGTIDAVADLTDQTDKVDAVTKRLAQVNDLVDTANDIADAANDITD